MSWTVEVETGRGEDAGQGSWPGGNLGVKLQSRRNRRSKASPCGSEFVVSPFRPDRFALVGPMWGKMPVSEDSIRVWTRIRCDTVIHLANASGCVDMCISMLGSCISI